MSECISFTIEGEARAFARARSNGKIRFTPKPQSDHMAFIKLRAVEAFKGRRPFVGPVKMIVRVHYEIPQSWSKKKQANAEWVTKRPDADNLAKIVADSLNGIAYVDDAQIVDLSVQKKYCAISHTTVTIMELGGA